MPNTHGFQVVTEVSVNFLRNALRAAWKSGGKKLGEPLDPGTIPESLDITAATNFGSFVLKDGHIQIPQDQLDLTLVPDFGVDIKVGLKGQAELQNAQNPAVPSLRLQDITADVHVRAPVGPLVGPTHVANEIGISFVPAPATTVTLTGPDPAARIDQLIAEQIRTLAAGAAPPPEPAVVVVYHSIPAYTVTELLVILSDATHQIDVVRLPGSPPHLRVKVPVQFNLYNIAVQPGLNPPPPLLQGFVVEATLVVTALLEPDPTSPEGFQVRLNAPTTTLTVENILPQGALDHYSGNQMRLGAEFATIVDSHIKQRGMAFLALLGDLAISIPTVASIQNSLANLIKDEMSKVESISIWPPKASPGVPLSITDAKAKVFSDAMALAINGGTSGDANALTNFIPAGRDLACAISVDGVNNVFETIKRTQNPFHRYHGDDHDFDLHSLSISLRTGALHFDGDMTVIDAIAGSIDVDASFGVDVHLAWAANNSIAATPDTPDVDVDISVLGWIVSLILGFFTFGAVGAIIAVVVVKVCESVAANIGADITQDPSFTAIAAWPSDLLKIGTVDAHFDNPIDITPEGLMFSATVAP